MLKKLLKSLLAIAVVSAMSGAAYAETTVGGYASSSFGMDTGTAKVSLYGEFDLSMKGESASAQLTGTINEGTYGVKNMVVDWMLTDSVTMSIGTWSAAGALFPMLGKTTIRNMDFSIPYGSIRGPGLFDPTSQGLQFAVKLGGAGRVNAGIVEGSTMTYYAIYDGSAGSLSYVAGAKTTASDMIMQVDVGFEISDAMDVTFDYAMQGSSNIMKLGFNMAQLGPGDMRFAYNSMGSTTSMALKYAYAIQPGAGLEAIYTSQGSSNWMGVSLFGRF
jgi:hypothetical protein